MAAPKGKDFFWTTQLKNNSTSIQKLETIETAISLNFTSGEGSVFPEPVVARVGIFSKIEWICLHAPGVQETESGVFNP